MKGIYPVYPFFDETPAYAKTFWFAVIANCISHYKTTYNKEDINTKPPDNIKT